MTFLLPAIMALASGAGNMFSNSQQRTTLNSRIDSLIQEYRKAMIDKEKLNTQLNRTSGYFNSAMTNSLNEASFKTKNSLNAPIVKAAMTSNIQGHKAQAMIGVENRAEEINQGILGKISQLEMGKDNGSPIGDFLGGAVQGGIAGAQINQIMDMDKPEPTFNAPNRPGISSNPGGELLSNWKSPLTPLPDVKPTPEYNSMMNKKAWMDPNSLSWFSI